MGSDMFPLVSIIIPVYNHEKYIIETIESIIADFYPNKELVLINDGSTDNSHQIISEWIESNQNRIIINYLNRENRGVSATINELIDRSNGKYIIGLGSDDYLINNTIAERVQLLQNNPNKLMVIGDAIVVDGKGKTTHESGNFGFHHGNKENYFTDKGLKYEIICNWSVVGPVGMVNRKIYDVIGRYDSSLIVEDWDFYLRAVSKDMIIFLDEKVAAYRLHGKNTISNLEKQKRMIEDLAKTAHQNIKNFDSFYLRYLLRKKYFDIQKSVNHMEKNYISPAKQLSFKENYSIVKNNHKLGAISKLEYLISLKKILKYSIRKKLGFKK